MVMKVGGRVLGTPFAIELADAEINPMAHSCPLYEANLEQVRLPSMLAICSTLHEPLCVVFAVFGRSPCVAVEESDIYRKVGHQVKWASHPRRYI